MTVSLILGSLEYIGNHTASSQRAFTNLAGVDDDPDAVQLTIRKPDDTLVVYAWPTPTGSQLALAKEATGRFYAAVDQDQSGKWRARLAGTGTPTAAAEFWWTVRRSVVA